MTTQDQYKDDAIRLLFVNPVFVMEILTEDIRRTHFHIKHFNADINIGDGGTVCWSCSTEVIVLAASMPVDIDNIWTALQKFFAQRGLAINLRDKSAKKHFTHAQGQRIYTGSDFIFKVVFKPDRDLMVSCLYD